MGLLIEQLAARWRDQKASARVHETVAFREGGEVVLGADTLLWKHEGRADCASSPSDDARLKVLLLAAYGEPADAAAINHLKAAARRQDAGQNGRAEIHLALSKLGPLRDPMEASRRLFMADGLMKGGAAPETILKALEPQSNGLTRYSANQPRVPAGSGRPSGQWTSLAAGLAAAGMAGRRLLRPAVHMAGTAATTVGRAAAKLDLGSLGPKALGGLADFAATATEGLTTSSALAAGGAATAFFGVLFIPSSGPKGVWVKVAGPGDISYRHNPDEMRYQFRYTTPDGVSHTLTSAPDPDGNFRGPRGDIIARLVKTATRTGLLVSTASLLGRDTDEPKLCPKPGPDRNQTDLGRIFEDQMKPITNPGNPTPSGFAYYFENKVDGGLVSIDDCQHLTGTLFEYKGPNYSKHLQKDDFVWQRMLIKIMNQSKNQVSSKGNRELIWVFDEPDVAKYFKVKFKSRYGNQILVLSASEYRERQQ